MRKHKFLSICASVLLSLSVLTTGVLADTAESTASEISTASDTSTSETDTTTNTVVAKSSEMGFPCDKLTDPNSASIYMVSLDTDTVVYTYNPDERRPMASMTKIMTYIVTAETVSDLQNTRTTVPESVAEELEGTGSSLAEIQTGESFTIYELLNLMMVPSGNDAALTLAKYVDSLNITADDPQYDEDGDGKMSCVELMNKKAAELGCTNTHFVNPHGLYDENHYTTARDLAIIAQACMKDERFAAIVSQTSYDMPATQTESGSAGHPRRTIVGSTAILNAESTSYYRYATGIKTGYTLPAGYCFVGSATKGGINLISVVLYDGDTRRYEDTKRLFEYGFTQIESITPESLYAEDPRVIDITGFDTSDAQHGELTLGIRAVDDTKDMIIVGRKDNIDFLRENFGQVSSIRWTREFRAPINVGDVMGILTFYSENEGTAEYELVATRSIAARADAPLTLEQIEAYTAQEENPWPRFSWDLLVPPGLILLAFIWLIRFVRKHHKKRIKAPKIQPTKKKYLR